MTAVARLRLDTTAPALTWGPLAQLVAGEDFAVLYTLDEGSVTDAELALLGGRVVQLDYTDTQISGHVPDDAPDGQARVRAYVVDDVGNAAVQELQVQLSGAVVVPPPNYSASGGLPLPPVVLRSRSSAVAASDWSSRSVAHLAARAEARTLVRVRPHIFRTRPSGAIDIQWRAAVRQPSSGAGSVEAHASIQRTMESQAHEDELILAGIL